MVQARETALTHCARGQRAGLAEALAEGRVAVAPERAVMLGDKARLGWWLVDPMTGATRDQMDDGRGSVMAEDAYLIKVVGHQGAYLICLGLVTYEMYHFAHGLLETTFGDGTWLGFVAATVAGNRVHHALCL